MAGRLRTARARARWERAKAGEARRAARCRRQPGARFVIQAARLPSRRADSPAHPRRAAIAARVRGLSARRVREVLTDAQEIRRARLREKLPAARADGRAGKSSRAPARNFPPRGPTDAQENRRARPREKLPAARADGRAGKLSRAPAGKTPRRARPTAAQENCRARPREKLPRRAGPTDAQENRRARPREKLPAARSDGRAARLSARPAGRRARPPVSAPRMNSLEDVHVARRAEHERRALVQLGRDDVEDAVDAGGGLAAGGLEDERQGVRLVEEAELALRALLVGGVGEDAALEQRAVRVGDERADVALAVGAAGAPCRRLDPGVPAADGLGPEGEVALVDRVRLALARGCGCSRARGRTRRRSGSSVKPWTPPFAPVESTSMVDDAVERVPGGEQILRRAGGVALVAGPLRSGRRRMPKMVPMEMLTSMLLEPSSGSKTTT